MEFKTYQTRAPETAVYPTDQGVTYNALALAGEAGEVAGKVSKLIRDGDSGRLRFTIKGELGDVLWHLTLLARDLGTDLETVARENLHKLQGRAERGTIGGSGDER